MKKIAFLFALTMLSLSSYATLFSNPGQGLKSKQALSAFSLKDSTEDKWELNKHILFGVGTGVLGGNRYKLGDNTLLKAPLLVTGERSGKFGKFSNLPNWLYYGFYFRYSKQEYTYDYYSGPSTITSTVIGAGARASCSVLAMANDLGWDKHKKSRIDPYIGFQLGYDIVSFDYSDYGYYNNGWGYASGLRLTPMVGMRFFPTHWLGIQAEIGGTSNRFLSAGIVIRA
jgi:hypothetical protein